MGKTMEIWLPVVGFEGFYEVSNFGNIKTVKTGKIKIPTKSKIDNRPYIGLWKFNKVKICKPHTLVLTAFIGKRQEGFEGCHNDGNPCNNHIDNLRWDTTRNNQLDRIKHGTSNRGERSATAKLTEDQVAAIRKDTRLQKEIAADYGVKENTISRIKSGKRWSHSYHGAEQPLSGILS